MLSVAELSCVRADHTLFSGVGFDLAPGECLHLEGGNGVGKTTLARLVAGAVSARFVVLKGALARLELLASLDPRELGLRHPTASGDLGAAGLRLEQFSRMLDRLENQLPQA